MDPHRIAEARSLALHRLLAERLLVDPRVVQQARALAARWLAEGRATHYMKRWLELLSRDLREVASTIVREDEDLRALRQCTPFAGIISPRERWELWRTVRQRCEAAQ